MRRFQALLSGQVGVGGLGGRSTDQDYDAQQDGGGEFHADQSTTATKNLRYMRCAQNGRILTLPRTRKSGGGAPLSDLAFMVRARAKAPCRRSALRWQC